MNPKRMTTLLKAWLPPERPAPSPAPPQGGGGKVSLSEYIKGGGTHGHP